MAQSTMAAVAALKETYGQLKTRMEKAVEDFRHEMASVRTGRASVHMLDNVQIDYYGTMTPLNQVAQVHAPEAQLITVQPFDPTSATRDRESDPQLGSGIESDERRQDDSRARPAAHRRTPQRHGEAPA